MIPLRTAIGFGFLGTRLAAGARRRRRAVSLGERLAQVPQRELPVREPVRIRWNDHHVPFIEAAHDRDLAVALGVVHAHLRLSQIEFMRRAAHGRLAEALGPAAIEIDHVIRTLGVTRAVPAIRDMLPDDTRDWLEGFVDGINAVLGAQQARPEELALLGLRPDPWTIDDVLAIGRIAGADFTWKVWVPLLRLRGRSDWMKLWARVTGAQNLAAPSFAGGGLDGLLAVCGAFARTGSNSVAVAASRSATGGAMMASDPHLSVGLPNLWLMAGIRSPGYHAVGLMLPGVPVMALGRNPWIAWGGTSLHAASSDLFDVSDLAEGMITARPETIPVRWWRDETRTVRDTAFGPIITDAPLLKAPLDRQLALRWMGHQPSDETTAMLRVGRARNWEEFLTALDGWAVPALNMTYADTQGRVGQCMAARLPARPHGAPGDLFLDRSAAAHWQRSVTATSLPWTLDPADGVVASANDRPEEAPEVPVGYFFAPKGRVNRLRALVSGPPVTVETLKAAQRDVFMASALELRDRVLALLDRAAGAADRPERRRLLDILERWDGEHTPDSAGPVALELLVYHFVRELHGPEDVAVYAGTWEPWSLVRQDLATQPEPLLVATLDAAARTAEQELGRFRRWGDMHRLALRHPLGGAPLVGRRYRFAEFGVGGSNETLMKTSHGFSSGRHNVRLGAVARHISDLADPDANAFCLLGGQDGWLGSATFLDQLALWREGRYIPMPLSPEAAAALFPHVTDLAP